MRNRPRWAVRLTLGIAVALAVIIVVTNLGSGAGGTQQHSPKRVTARDLARLAAAKPPGRPKAKPRRVVRKRHITLGVVVLHLVDSTRTVSISGQSVQRSFDT